MTYVNYRGAIWLKITKSDWEWGGGETNPDLLKLRNTRRHCRGYCYFRFHAEALGA